MWSDANLGLHHTHRLIYPLVNSLHRVCEHSFAWIDRRASGVFFSQPLSFLSLCYCYRRVCAFIHSSNRWLYCVTQWSTIHSSSVLQSSADALGNLSQTTSVFICTSPKSRHGRPELNFERDPGKIRNLAGMVVISFHYGPLCLQRLYGAIIVTDCPVMKSSDDMMKMGRSYHSIWLIQS